MALLTKQQIWDAPDQVCEEVLVPEWGGSIRIRSLNGHERDHYESSSVTFKGSERTINLRNIRARLVVLSAIDDNGQPLFDQTSDVIRLGQKSAAALNRVFERCQKISGLTNEDVEELAGNLESGQSSDSGTDSPSVLAA